MSASFPPTRAAGTAQASETLSDLLREAVDRSRLEAGSHDAEWEEAIRNSETADDMVKIVEECAGGFENFRERGERVRRNLQPIAAFVRFFAEEGGEVLAVSSRPPPSSIYALIIRKVASDSCWKTSYACDYQSPEGRQVSYVSGPYWTPCQQMANAVTEMYDTVEAVLVQISDALRRFDVYLQPSVPTSTELRKSFISSLIVTLELVGTITKRYNDESSRAPGGLGRRLSTSSSLISDNTF